MNPNRRSFFGSLLAAPAALAVARPLVATSSALAAVESNNNNTEHLSASQAFLDRVASNTHDQLMEQLVLGRKARRDFEGVVMQYRDYVNVPPTPRLVGVPYGEANPVKLQGRPLENLHVQLTRHWGCSFFMGNLRSAINLVLPEYCAKSAGISLAQALDEMLCTRVNGRQCTCLIDASMKAEYPVQAIPGRVRRKPEHEGGDYTKALLVTRRLAPVLGVLCSYVERDGVGIRAIMSSGDRQILSVDVLAGVTVV